MGVTVIQGDITRIKADAIVNAANPALAGGGGVDGAIHQRAGPALLAACLALPEVRPGVRCPSGEARATPAFNLPAHHVIHTVGPIWHGGRSGEAKLLAACYRNSLTLARELGDVRIVFPAISCGVYGYPPQQAARIAVQTVMEELAAHDSTPLDVLLCCYGATMRDVFGKALRAAGGRSAVA